MQLSGVVKQKVVVEVEEKGALGASRVEPWGLRWSLLLLTSVLARMQWSGFPSSSHVTSRRRSMMAITSALGA
ncbi:hypothetical protein CC2G_007733 [Coprinopsis cinerea AmutBmut pab1-1]|nr:hypothetical protein CC2G_007733 [Coprinopsis cinerea AmutBmut pab1-1]